MTSPADRAVAIVGVGAILPDAPDAERVLGQRLATATTRSATSTRRAGIRRSTTTPTRRRRSGPTRRSAAGCASGTGTRWPGSCRSRRSVSDAMDDAQKWAVACTRMALDGLRLAGAAARPRAHRRDPRQRDGGRAALPDDAAHHVPRAGARPRRRAELRRAAAPTCARAITGELHARMERDLPADHRGHDAGRAVATASPAASRTCSTCAGRTTSSTRRARRRWRRWTPRSRAWSSASSTPS